MEESPRGSAGFSEQSQAVLPGHPEFITAKYCTVYPLSLLHTTHHTYTAPLKQQWVSHQLHSCHMPRRARRCHGNKY